MSNIKTVKIIADGQEFERDVNTDIDIVWQVECFLTAEHDLYPVTLIIDGEDVSLSMFERISPEIDELLDGCG